MAESILETAKELVLALIQAGQLDPEASQVMLQDTFRAIDALVQSSAPRVQAAVPASKSTRENWRTSIGQHAIVCMECGATFKQLSRKHLAQHGLDMNTYRDRFGIPESQPLVARLTHARRSQVAKQFKPWQKTKNWKGPKTAATKRATAKRS